MSEIKVGKTETLESALRRFKRSCQKAGVLSEVRKREHYEKPSVKRKKNLKQQENANSEHKMITLILPFHGFMKSRIRGFFILFYLKNDD